MAALRTRSAPPTVPHVWGASMPQQNTFGARATLHAQQGPVDYSRLDALQGQHATPSERLPFTLRILVENALRHHDLAPDLVSEADVLALARWQPATPPGPSDPGELPFLPARVILQDFTGVPAVVDLAAIRDAVQEPGGDPNGIHPRVPSDLGVDASVQGGPFRSTPPF